MIFVEFDQVAALCRTRAPEGLHLEFKEKQSPERPELDSGDKKAIAKAVCAFANSGGGTLVFGVRTAKVGDVDVADELRSIRNPEICRTQVEYVCRTNISPEVPGVEVRALIGPGDAGVVVCQVPHSERRPHMSTAPGVHTYFRRTFQGDVPMTPFEVQEQVLAVREATIEPTAKVARGASFSSASAWIAIGYSVQFGLENIGSRTCRNPFLRVRSSENGRSNNAAFDQRLDAWKSDLASGSLIHVDDALPLFGLEFIARVPFERLFTASSGTEEHLLDAVRIYRGGDDLHSPTITDKIEIEGLEFGATYGAENAVARTKEFYFTRREIAANILTRHEDHIRDRAIAAVGVWRADLVENIRTALKAGEY
jgi:hypothetical protein